jgi:peptidyl-prolyl cis-trans isomerase D
MFEFVRTHKRVMQFVLVLLVFPSFVFFGIQGYTRFKESGNQPVANVDGQTITQAEWDAAHRNQVERARRQMPQLDAKLFDAAVSTRACWLRRGCRRSSSPSSCGRS